MKELIKNRIDILIDKAREGNARAQLRLAKCFYNGHLVERSVDLAKYWAFKAMVGGNSSATDFYQAVVDNKNYTLYRLCSGLVVLTVAELFCGFILSFIFANVESIEDWLGIPIGMAITGFVSMILGGMLFRKMGTFFIGRNGAEIGYIIGTTVVHVLALCVVLKQVGVL